MVITIKLKNDDQIQTLNSLEEVLNLKNFNDIISLYCINCKIKKIPKLPTSLVKFNCEKNLLTELPSLPNSLLYLYCNNNNLFRLPDLPKNLKKLVCYHNNNLEYLPYLPNKLEHMWAFSTNIKNLPNLPETIETMSCWNTPILRFIQKYFNGDYILFSNFQKKYQKLFTFKIENWFLECKYNPAYLYCRNRLLGEYNDLFLNNN